MSRNLTRRFTLVLISCSMLLGCFEEPVQERVHIHIAGPRTFGVTVVQEQPARNHPVSVSLSRWIVDPEYAAAEQ